MPWSRVVKASLLMPLSASVVLAVMPSAGAVVLPSSVEPAAVSSAPSGPAKQSCVSTPGDGRKAAKRACVTLKLGKKKQSRVRAGDTITLKGAVRHERAREKVLIQELQGAGRFGVPPEGEGRWRTVERISHDGRFRLRRDVSWGHHVYRAKVRLDAAVRRSRAGLAESAPAAASSAAVTSATTTATAGSYGYGYVFANDTGRNLQLQYTGGGSTDTKSKTTAFDNKTLVVSVLRNPPKDFASAFTLKGSELGVKQTYKYDGSAGKRPCAKAEQPKLKLGGMTVVAFQNQTFGYKGTIKPPGQKSCTFNMLTSIEKFFAKQGPWAILLEIAAAVVIVAIVVALTVVTGGGDLPEIGEAAGALADSAEVGGDVVEEAGNLADEISEALEEELPNITKGDGWPPLAWTDGEVFGNEWKWVTVPFSTS